MCASGHPLPICFLSNVKFVGSPMGEENTKNCIIRKMFDAKVCISTPVVRMTPTLCHAVGGVTKEDCKPPKDR
jgi:hypothetical protein